MAKKPKIELTLEELQAKKSKRQRGWVRFCAILLAVVLTLGIFGMASQGGPNIVEVYPNVVRAQTKTVVQKQDTQQTEPADTDTEDEDTPSTPSDTSEEEGSFLDTILGLLGGLDLSGLIGGLDMNGMGITVANGIQSAKDSLLTLIDQLEAAISGKPTISHDAEEFDFDASVERGDEALREALVEKLNAATAPGVGYTVTRISMPDYENHPVNVENGESLTSIGAQTETVNKILLLSGTTLDIVVGAFNGLQYDQNSGDVAPITYNVAKGKTAEEAVAAAKYDAMYANYGLKQTALTADDIAILEADEENGAYVFALKDVANPNRRADCGLTRFTDDYLVQNEVAERMKNASGLTEVSTSPLKLTDLDIKYYSINVAVQFDVETGHLVNLAYFYMTDAKFTVRTNTVQVTGMSPYFITLNEYTNFYY
ncbi:MAG: hypothetical protein ACI4K6_06060 [Candidatus Fimenecus sp.]